METKINESEEIVINDSNNDCVYINPVLKKEDFLRHILLTYSNNRVPADIYNCEVVSVEDVNCTFLFARVNASMHISCSVGFDRQEQYITQESRKVKEGEKYVQNNVIKFAPVTSVYQVDTVKTKTVTDWKPYDLDYSNSSVECMLLNDDILPDKIKNSIAYRVGKFVDEHKDEFCDLNPTGNEEGLVQASASQLENIEVSGVNSVYRKGLYTMPGDHHKQESMSNVKSEIAGMFRAYVPLIKAVISYNGELYTYVTPAFINAFDITSDKNVEDNKNTSLEFKNDIAVYKKEGKEKYAKLVTAAFICFGVGLFCAAFSGLVSFLMPITGIGFISGIVLIYIWNKKVMEYASAKFKEKAEEFNSHKLKTCIELFEKLNLDSLTDEEKELFNKKIKI